MRIITRAGGKNLIDCSVIYDKSLNIIVEEYGWSAISREGTYVT